ncbi:MAG: hypothetical protein RBT37_09545 [Dissulfurispiraceae bacterium]|jgi:hypothetical protein|nr:hypothetical protein [Dissulfurispiraceae bacterium]
MTDKSGKNRLTENDRVYESAISRMREGLKTGLSFNEACSIMDVADPELRRFIEDDALKIVIAEMHYGKGTALKKLSKMLRLPYRVVYEAHLEMLEDAGLSAAEVYKHENFDNAVGNA